MEEELVDGELLKFKDVALTYPNLFKYVLEVLELLVELEEAVILI